jgi:predicted unusual protein kinase regulating ubiquinone biosynthesis (AarF/ABC1/UbiB family)
MAIEMEACEVPSRKMHLPMTILALVKGVCVKHDGRVSLLKMAAPLVDRVTVDGMADTVADDRGIAVAAVEMRV